MKALIAMSGGVDSSVAAYLMKKQGYECIGCTMKLFDAEDAGFDVQDFGNGKTCCSLDDVEDARSVAQRLNIPYYVFNYKDEFCEKVIDHFVESYKNGLTPNPCIECNRHLKFAKLLERAKELDCDCVATGHYARIDFDGEKYHLLRALDPCKDQSYVLYSLSQEQLSMIKFPLGDLSKSEVRKIAEEQGFLNAQKPDSQDICFVPDGDYSKVIKTRGDYKAVPGNFVDTSGNTIGKHKGTIHYTIGQRKGLGMGFGKPMFVLGIDPKTNTVVLGEDCELYSKEVFVRDVCWTKGQAPEIPIPCTAKIRYRQEASPAMLYPASRLPDGFQRKQSILSDAIMLRFDEPQRAATPGQAAVFYIGEELIGGGVIF